VYAGSFKGFPKRAEVATMGVYEKAVKYHGHKLFI
jgi:hypothetical protein